MDYETRKGLIEQVEALRPGRKMICFFNFDRLSEPAVPLGLDTAFNADTKAALFRVLKETGSSKIDICLYTRGGDVNGVWPLVSIVREFDPDFEVLVPFRCHSAGSLLALGAKKIVLTAMAELSPIDPSTGNQFNPLDPARSTSRLAISVEDVRAFRSFILDQFQIDPANELEALRQNVGPYLGRLAHEVHPLALGNVYRVHQQIQQLAKKLLLLHPIPNRREDQIIEALTTRFWSHLHMVNRYEARDILGAEHVDFASDELAGALDVLLRSYEDTFELRRPFFLSAFMGDETSKKVRFIGGVLESTAWGYLHETQAVLGQSSALPPEVQIQLPPGQPMPLIRGLPRSFHVEVLSRGWAHNKAQQGFDK
ncbi:MAG: hypothetical protein SFV15_14555 [Polyangiaceae bacterium]|nr:hypothetical protein [Polyangiaceae bacterium]